MKKHLIYIKILLAVLLTSCGKQLDIYPHSAASTESLSQDDIEAFVSGVYNKVQNSPGTESYVIFDLVGGNFINSAATGSGGINAFINNILRPEQGLMSTSWNGYYSALYQVNNLLYSASFMSASSRKNEIEGIAHFFRGYIYYNLITRWGGVPLIEKNTLEKLPRNSEAEVWSFIENELTIAINNAPDFSSNNYYLVSKPAAKALMARVKLAQGKKSEAAQLAEEVISSQLFKLDAFEKIFRGVQNSEVIFAFRNLTAESAIKISSLFYTYAHPVKGSYVYKPTQEVMGLFDVSDKRKNISIDTYSGNDVLNKYPSGQAGTDPFVVIRLAEMYLISAEGNGLTNGLPRLNELRKERGLAPVNPSNEDYIDAILLERRKEFLGEGFRWYDLVRLNKAIPVLGLSKGQVKFPIPTNELGLNDLLEPNDY